MLELNFGNPSQNNTRCYNAARALHRRRRDDGSETSEPSEVPTKTEAPHFPATLGDLTARQRMCLCASSQITHPPCKHASPGAPSGPPRSRNIAEPPNEWGMQRFPKFQGRRRGGGGAARARMIFQRVCSTLFQLFQNCSKFARATG